MIVDVNETAEIPFLSVREAGRRLDVHENTVRNWAAKGILRSARAPGARFHRFDPAEVERVRLARQSGPRTVQTGRRIIGPELADATRLGIWAGTQEARHVFPRLMRRLLAATPAVEDLSARAGEGVSVGGWDVRAKLTAANPWLPKGELIFELGVGASPGSKAQEDYDKRTENPLDVDPKKTVFVFATPRRWSGGRAWAAGRHSEKVWRTVKVLDGDDIEGWLEGTPTVHYWISEQIGLHPTGVETAERWWQRFSHRTHPVLPPALILAGRKNARADLQERLATNPTVTGIRAAWRDDALAFVCAALGANSEDGAPDRPALVVSSAEVWQRMAASPGAMTMIPLFADPDIALATANGKHVVVPFGGADAQAQDAIALPPPERLAAMEALRDADIEFQLADRLAALARRSMPALVRQLSVNPSFSRPAWSRPPASDVLSPLMLVGSWADNALDRQAVRELADRSWPDVERALRNAATSESPPFVESGGAWRVSSHAELFELLAGSLTTSDIRRWESLIARVLSELSPLIDLTGDERMLAGINRSAEPSVSGTLRQGLAEGLALLGSQGTRALVGAVTCGEVARVAVGKILDLADANESGALWRSLSLELPLIAEAAPEIFLRHVLAGSTGESPVLATMFRDDESQQSALGLSSPHTGLLWALETLSWSPDHLLEATRALAQLAAIDPGGSLSNRPQGSLLNVLVPWIRHTNAPLPLRVKTIDQVVRDFPECGWKLILGLWPSRRGFVMPPHAPRYRDWLPDQRTVLVAEWLSVIDHLVQHAIDLANGLAIRWTELVGRLGDLPPGHRDLMTSALEKRVAELAKEPEDRLALWEALNGEIGRHRAFPDAQWAMPEEALGGLETIAKSIEPSRSVERHTWLFDWRPDIGKVRSEDYGEYEAAVKDMREAAVRDTIDTASIEGIGRLAERAVVPRILGELVAELFGDDHRSTLLRWSQATGPRREVAIAWVVVRAYAEGADWIARVLHSLDDDQPRLLVAVQSPTTPELWALLSESFPTLVSDYWKQVSPYGIRSEHTPAAVRAFLAHNRAWAAITVLTLQIHRLDPNAPRLDPELVQAALEAAIAGRGEPEVRGDSLGYEIGILLDYLESQNGDPGTLARLEFALFPVFEYQREPRALYRALSEDPGLFVDLLSSLYRAKGAPRQTPDPQSAAAAQLAWRVLHNWRTIPGLRTDSSVDGQQLNRWVEKARLLLRDRDRVDVGDEQIGELLSGSPEGTDGAWPAEQVRDLIERIGSQELENGLHIGKSNARGITSRGVYDGGDQERVLAAQFRDWSSITAGRWPRTSRLLRELSESYEREAAREDLRASQAADAG